MDLQKDNSLTDLEKILIPMLEKYKKECEERNLSFIGAVDDFATEIEFSELEAA